MGQWIGQCAMGQGVRNWREGPERQRPQLALGPIGTLGGLPTLPRGPQFPEDLTGIFQP